MLFIRGAAEDGGRRAPGGAETAAAGHWKALQRWGSLASLGIVALERLPEQAAYCVSWCASHCPALAAFRFVFDIVRMALLCRTLQIL